MRRLYTSVLLTLFFAGNVLVARAQQTDFTRIIMPLDSPAADFREFLVQLAWLNSPEGAIAKEEVLNAQDKAQNIKKEWMRDIQGTVNLNEGNLNSSGSTVVTGPDGKVISRTTSANIFFPRYNFGVNLNLYNALSQKNKNKIGKRDVRIAEYEVNQQKLTIRAETLSRHSQYLLTKQVLQARRQVEQDTRSAYVLIEQQYRTDDKTFEDYSTASTNYYQAQEARMRAENDVTLALLRLEEVIGLSWDQVVHPGKQ